MNYAKLYNQITTHAQQTPQTGYTEDHHIIPRCMDGPDTPDNIVTLSARQHFICHWLLTKMHPEHAGLRYAFHMMFHPTSAGTRVSDWTTTRSRAYAYNKERCAVATGDRWRGVPKPDGQKEKIRLGTISRWANTESRVVQSSKLMGNKNSLGSPRPHTDDIKRLIGERVREYYQTNPHPRSGKKHTPETIAKIKEAKRLNPFKASPEQRAARSLNQQGKRQPPSQKQKVAAALSATWAVTTPDGVRMTVVNLRQFCLAHDLSQGNLVTHGHTKGYRAMKLVLDNA